MQALSTLAEHIVAESKRTQIWVVMALLALVCLSVVATSAWVLNSTDQSSSGDSGYRHVTMTDAYMVCTAKIKAKLGARLAGFGEDQLSSRYNQAKERFQMYFDAQVKKKSGITVPAYISCQVNDKGKVKGFGVSYAAKDGSRPAASDGHPFGFGGQ